MPEPASLFRRPLGLALAGGGALGAWQAGALDSLVRAGLRFDKIVGFSAGALAASAMALGRVRELVQRWREVDGQRILRFSPRLSPLSFFSGEPIWNSIQETWDDAQARREARCEFTVVGLDAETRIPAYWSFSPSNGRWDGPLAKRLMASCAIPKIFPPVPIDGRVFVDGGVPGKEPLSFAALAGCRDVIVLEMVRRAELGRSFWSPARRWDQFGRELVRGLMDEGVSSLQALPEAPRVFRVGPSAVLDYSALSFRSRHCAPALNLGLADGAALLAAPERALVADRLVLQPAAPAPARPGLPWAIAAGAAIALGAGYLALRSRRASAGT